MKSILLSLFILITCTLAAQQTYSTSFETTEEQDAWTFFQLGPEEHEFYRWEFLTTGGIDENVALGHFYPVGGADITDDWVVSPVFDFTGGGEINSISYQFSGFGTPFGIDTVALYLITGNVNPDLASEKTLLRLYSDENYMNDSEIRMDSGIAIPATSGESYLAFRYKTVINWLDVKFDALELTYTPMMSGFSSTIESKTVKVSPNPASDFLNIQFAESNPISNVEIYDCQGRLVSKFAGNNSVINIENLESGLYIIRLVTETGEEGLSKFLVEK